MASRSPAVQRSGGQLQTGVECVEDRRFPDAAVADERRRPALYLAAKLVDAFAGLGRAWNDGDAQIAVGAECGELTLLLVLVEQIDLVDADDGRRAAALDGDEVTIDEPGSQRRRLHRH